MTSTYRPRVQDLVHPEEQQGYQSRQEHVHKHSANKSKNSKLQIHKSTKNKKKPDFSIYQPRLQILCLIFFPRRNTPSSARLIFLPTVCTSYTSSTILAASLFVTISHLLLQVCTCSAIFWESCREPDVPKRRDKYNFGHFHFSFSPVELKRHKTLHLRFQFCLYIIKSRKAYVSPSSPSSRSVMVTVWL